MKFITLIKGNDHAIVLQIAEDEMGVSIVWHRVLDPQCENGWAVHNCKLDFENCEFRTNTCEFLGGRNCEVSTFRNTDGDAIDRELSKLYVKEGLKSVKAHVLNIYKDIKLLYPNM